MNDDDSVEPGVGYTDDGETVPCGSCGNDSTKFIVSSNDTMVCLDCVVQAAMHVENETVNASLGDVNHEQLA